MKHGISRIFAMLIALLIPEFTFAVLNVGSQFNADGVDYIVTGTNPPTVKVGRNNGGYAVETGRTTPLDIPSKVKDADGNEYTVTGIGRQAFVDCHFLQGVTIPNTVTYIEAAAFDGCRSITSIVIPSSVTSIKGNPFWYCTSLSSIVVESGNPAYDSRDNCNAIINSATNKLMVGCMSTVIPSTVTSIYSEAFYSCGGLKSITIPKSVTCIEDNPYQTRPFMVCQNLSEIKVEEGNPVYDSRDNCNAIIKTATNELLVGSNSTVIPSSVTAIGFGAFNCRIGLNTITIPEAVTRIDSSAFSSCYGFQSITIPAGVRFIGQRAFAYCKNLKKVKSKIKEPFAIDKTAFEELPDNVILFVPAGTKEKYEVLEGWKVFKTISEGDPDEVHIGDTFKENEITYMVTGLSPLTVQIGDGQHRAIPSTKSGDFEVPSSVKDSEGNIYTVTGIGNISFLWCNLTSVTIPNTVTTIGAKAFYESASLKSVAIPNSVTTIGNIAFANCTSLTSITIPNSMTKIADGLFQGCRSLASVTIPNSVTTIGGNAFSDCTGLTSVTIPNSVTSIGFFAFYGCSSLTSATISNSMTKINAALFEACSSLTSITIPNAVTSIEMYAFTGCSNLTSFNIPSSVTYIGHDAFAEIGWINNQPDGILYKDNWLLGYKGEKPEGSLVVHEGTIGIASYALCECSGLTSVTLPNSLKGIGELAFYECSGLTDFSIPNSVMKIGTYAFHDTGWYNNQPDGNLYKDNWWVDYKGQDPMTISIAEGTEKMAEGAFCGSEQLTSVTLPNSIIMMGSNAFADCKKLKKVKSYIEEPFALSDNIFKNWSDETQSMDSFTPATLYVPAGTKEKYEATEGWENFQTIIEGDFDKPTVGDVFQANHVTYVVTNTEPLTAQFGNDDFGSVSEPITGDYEIPSTVTDSEGKTYTITGIGSIAFYYFTDLTSITIPNTVTYIGTYSFYNCNSLTSIVIPNAVESIAVCAFCGCQNLTSVIFPSSIKLIDEYAFFDCPSLKEVRIFVEEPFAISESVFGEISDDETLYVPYGTKAKYESTEGWCKFKNIVEMEPTNIDCVKNGTQSEVFTLTGLKVGNNATSLKDLKKGIYIIEGRKTIVK